MDNFSVRMSIYSDEGLSIGDTVISKNDKELKVVSITGVDFGNSEVIITGFGIELQ